MKNTFTDLNNHLFEQLERLNDDDLKGDDLRAEITRAQAMAGTANTIIDLGRMVLDASVKVHEYRMNDNPLEALSDGRKKKGA